MKVVPRENTGCIHDAERETVESELSCEYEYWSNKAFKFFLSHRQKYSELLSIKDRHQGSIGARDQAGGS